MSYFTKIEKLPELDLLTELHDLIANNTLSWDSGKNQICLNTITGYEEDYILGTGSLTHDWDNNVTVIDAFGNETVVVKEKENRLYEHDFNILCKQFTGTMFETIYNVLDLRYNLGRVRLMRSTSKTCLSWHVDFHPRLHYPLKTQDGCFMVIEDEVKHLPKYEWWMSDTLRKHTAFNASKEDRIHLVATILGIK
jgi:hypothetical protein